MPPLPMPPPSYLKSKTTVCLPGLQGVLGRDVVVGDVRHVVMENRLAVLEHQRVAAGQSALRHQHALFVALWEDHIGGDAERLVLDVRRRAFRDARHGSVVGELGASAREAGTDGTVHPLDTAVVQRQHVVLGRLGIEQQLEFVKLVGILVRKVDGLAEVIRDVVELPLVAVDHIDPDELGLVLPGPAVGRRGAGHPAVVIDGAVAEHLEILRVAR